MRKVLGLMASVHKERNLMPSIQSENVKVIDEDFEDFEEEGEDHHHQNNNNSSSLINTTKRRVDEYSTVKKRGDSHILAWKNYVKYNTNDKKTTCGDKVSFI